MKRLKYYCAGNDGTVEESYAHQSIVKPMKRLYGAIQKRPVSFDFHGQQGMFALLTGLWLQYWVPLYSRYYTI